MTYEFLLNFLSKKTLEEQLQLIEEKFRLVAKYEATVLNVLIPLLQEKRFRHSFQINQRFNMTGVAQRESTFIKNELKRLIDMIDGTEALEKQ